MPVLGVKKKAQKMNMPHLASLVENGALEMAKAGEASLSEDWDAEPKKHKCDKCKGSGFDYKDGIPCIACDGSGIEYMVHYGVSDGKAYAYISQYGLDAIKEYCKACREAEVDKIRANASMISPFALPAFARVDMIAEGIPVDEMLHDGKLIRELANMVYARYPEFMKTNLTSF